MCVTTKVAYLNEVKNIHICLVTISLAKGGAERAVANQSRMWHDMGARVTIVVLNHEIAYPYAGQIWSLDRKKSQKVSFGRWSRFQQLKKFLKTEQPDFVIDHRPKNNYAKEWLYKKWLYRGLQIIYVTHSAHVPMYMTQWPKYFARLCQSNWANVGVSQWIEKNVLGSYAMKKTQHIPNGIEPTWTQDHVEASQVAQRPYLLWYGRLDDSVKDISFLIKAYTQSKAPSLGIDLRIMCQGPDRALLEKKSRETGHEACIVFMDFQADPRPIIAGARAVLLTSFFEGFPMVLIEALSLGTPVISFDINSGPNEIIRDQQNGLLVGQRNSRIFAQAIDCMCLDEYFYQLCRDNAQDSVRHFSMAQIATQWKALVTHE